MGGLVTEVERQYPKVWLITGSSGGVGRAIVEAALAAGDQVLATARGPVRLQGFIPTGFRFGDPGRIYHYVDPVKGIQSDLHCRCCCRRVSYIVLHSTDSAYRPPARSPVAPPKKSATLFTEPIGWLEKQFRTASHDKDSRELQCISSPPFRGWLPWRMARMNPIWCCRKCGALRIGSTRCETEMMEQRVAQQLASLS